VSLNDAKKIARPSLARYDLRRHRLTGILRASPLTTPKVARVLFLGKRASPRCYNYPVVYRIEMTNPCTLNCRMCWRLEELKAKGAAPGEMRLESLRENVDQIRSVYLIRLFGPGEPLFHGDLLEMIGLCPEKGVRQISITTNGLLLSGERQRALVSSRLTELRVSINGPYPQTYRKIRNGGLELAVENVRLFTASSAIPISSTSSLGKRKGGSRHARAYPHDRGQAPARP